MTGRGCDGCVRALGDHEAFLKGVGEQRDDRRRVVVLQRVEDLYSSDMLVTGMHTRRTLGNGISRCSVREVRFGFGFGFGLGLGLGSRLDGGEVRGPSGSGGRAAWTRRYALHSSQPHSSAPVAPWARPVPARPSGGSAARARSQSARGGHSRGHSVVYMMLAHPSL